MHIIDRNSVQLDLSAFVPKKGRKRGGRNSNAAEKDKAAEEGALLVRNSGMTRKQAADYVIAKHGLTITNDTLSRVISAKLIAS